MLTLYEIADTEIRICIAEYLTLTEDTNGFSEVSGEAIDSERKAVILLAGINAPLEDLSARSVVEEWRRRRAIPFDVEAGITAGVYTNIRGAGDLYLNEVRRETSGYENWPVDFIHENPHTLPLLQHLAGIFSKAALKRQIGSVSDKNISRPAAARLAALLADRVQPEQVRDGEVLQRLEATLEGIVRDLVGRVLLESIVESALSRAGVPFKREEEYSEIQGVVYNHRADFAVPDEISPMALIEVRKSSSRHASLYAKDKMFSAINWKGMHQDTLAILVVDGEWTAETLRVMAKVFDYVVPLHYVNELADTVKEYVEGDRSKLKWLIDFRISPNRN